MTTAVQNRILTTIFFSDIHGYSRRMKEDEERTLHLLRLHNCVFERAIADNRGRVVKTIGDAFMAQFPAPSQALKTAVAVQQALAELRRSLDGFDIQARIGIHVDEVVEADGDLFGHGVNIAARTEPLAAPGRIALTKDAMRQLVGQVPYTLHDRGSKPVKNIGELAVYEVEPEAEATEASVPNLVDLARRASHPADAGSTKSETASATQASIDYALVQLGARPLSVERPAYTAEAVRLVREGRLPAVAFQGLPGIGKTTLLIAAAMELAPLFPLGLTIRLDGPAASEPAFLLEQINHFLTALGRAQDWEKLRRREPKQALAALVSSLVDRRVLVLMDGIDEVPESWLDEVLKALSAAPQIRALAAMRERRISPQRAHLLPVAPLNESETRDLILSFSRGFGLDLDPDELIRKLPASVKTHPQALAALLTALQDFPLDLLVGEKMEEPGSAAVQVIERMVEGLTTEERRTLALTAVLSDLDLSRALQGLRLPPTPDLLGSIQKLLSRSLLQRRGRAYIVPELVADALRATEDKSFREMEDSIREALLRAVDRASDPDADLAVVSLLAAQLCHREWRQGRSETIRSLAREDFLELLNRRGFWKEYCVLLRLGFEASKQAGDRPSYHQLGFRLARKTLQTGDVETSKGTLAEMASSIDRAGNSLELAELHSHMALLYEGQRQTDDALRELLESRRIREELGDERGLPVVDKLIGNIYLRRRKYDLARQSFEQALEQLKKQPGSKEQIEVQTSLALCDISDGDLESAEARLRGVIEECRRVRYDAGLPRAQLNLASVVERAGQSKEALELASMAAQGAAETDPTILAGAKLMISRLEESLVESQGGDRDD